MPYLAKKDLRRLIDELSSRYSYLRRLLDEKELDSASDGLVRSRWRNPELVCKTVGSTLDIHLAVADFKVVLNEIGKLK